ncbi:MAG: DoxX family protein [Rhodothermales bacterium]|nr:DoxX family protein [Rhodothermales bacterium]MBO6781505.1 DoxX family protein [Rhodothermales bacterium]
MSSVLIPLLQIVIAFGLLNVWLIRSDFSTRYRGKGANSLRAEFEAYGLPGFMYYLVGGLKILAAFALLFGLFFPVLVQPAAILVAVLMVGALAMHLKVSDPVKRSVPAATVLALSLLIVIF